MIMWIEERTSGQIDSCWTTTWLSCHSFRHLQEEKRAKVFRRNFHSDSSRADFSSTCFRSSIRTMGWKDLWVVWYGVALKVDGSCRSLFSLLIKEHQRVVLNTDWHSYCPGWCFRFLTTLFLFIGKTMGFPFLSSRFSEVLGGLQAMSKCLSWREGISNASRLSSQERPADG